ncbi:hypothetical protein [Aureibaculum luteum]|uniref:hypothetical protein n=1 Tax=Aureibaculum luteum TaxID=1548456 RepID=UPI000E4B921B|nr:hypothetical protein [Aureibaculum luteum]
MKNIKHPLKHIKHVLTVGTFALLFISTVACDKDNDPNINKTAFQPHSDQGNNLVLTYPDGTKEYINGDSVLGWGSGHLLGGNYFKQVMGGGSEKGFVIRINIPPNTKKEEIIGAELKLDGARLYLQNSSDIPLRPELWIRGDGFDVYENATGKIKIIETDSYDIIGEVNAEVTDINFKSVKISGFFWKKKADPYSN